MLRPVSRMVILASVELNGELMQEIHQIWHWNELEAIFYFVLITIKGVFNFSVSLKHKEQNNTNKNLFWAPFITKCDILICGSSPTLISYFWAPSIIRCDVLVCGSSPAFLTIVKTLIWF